MSSSSADRALVVASIAVTIFAVVARLHDIVAYPAIYDFDASGHAVSVVDLFEGHLPNPRSWCGSHPPLFYAIGAALWAVLPESAPLHVVLRAVSVAAFVGTIGLVWRALCRLGSTTDAAVVGTLLLGVPGFVIASCMMTNDPLCAFFVTAVLVRLLDVPAGAVPSARHAAITGALAGLATVTKATGMAAVGMATLFYAWRSRRQPSRALSHAVVVGVVAIVIGGPHYARLFLSLAGSPYEIVGTRAGSQEKEAIGWAVYAITRTYTPFRSLPKLFNAALWGDPTSTYLPLEAPIPYGMLSAGGLVVLAVGLAGMARLLRRPEIARRSAAILLFGALYLAALLPLAVTGPYLVLTKTNYLLPAILPAGILLALGLGGIGGRGGTVLRALLIAIAASGVAATWYGWWEPARPAPVAVVPQQAAGGSPVRAVEDYFAYRVHDPVRALELLAPDVQFAHDLRLVRILRVPFTAEPGLTADDERSLELARARVAWLELYNLVRWMQPMLAAFDIRVLDVKENGDDAEVQVRVAPLGDEAPVGAKIGLWPFPAFEQTFSLRRTRDSWRITSIAQRGAVAENAVQAFAAHPTLAALDGLRALGWQPPWEPEPMSPRATDQGSTNTS